MIRRTVNGIVFYQFTSFIPYGEVLHAVFTRVGGTSQGAFQSLNVGHFIGDNTAAVEANH
ncbi:MAG: laccase domain-containing protein, partial [Chloroflexi bacterium]|nr:laccase domain-containing protein [Chloroflexota bacterium]